jgi:hypothetical protein
MAAMRRMNLPMKSKRDFLSQNGGRFLRGAAKRKQEIRGLPLDVIKGNKIRAKFSAISKKLALAPVREIGSGVDYIHWFYYGPTKKTMKLDIKFSFGLLGENTVAVRVAKDSRRLINNSDWVLAFDRNNQMHIFQTSKLSEYVSKHWGSIDKGKKIDKGTYSVYPVKLPDLFAKVKVQPITVKLAEFTFKDALRKMRETQFGKEGKAPATEAKKSLTEPISHIPIKKTYERAPGKNYYKNPSRDVRQNIRSNSHAYATRRH